MTGPMRGTTLAPNFRMARAHLVSMGLAALTFTSVAQARETSTIDAANPSSTTATTTPAYAARNDTRDKVTREPGTESKDRTKDFTLAIEGAANIPLDVGFEAGVDMPFGLRIFGGYGWIVAPYSTFLRGASIADGPARVTINEARASGYLLRAKLGIRPFRKLGLYFDAGYARAELDGSVDLTGSVSGVGSISGGYNASSSLDLWLVELGYQAKIENRLVLAAGLGFTGTIAANTTVSPLGVAQQSDPTAIRLSEASADRALEKYGYIPTLNLKLGFNLL